MTGIIGIGNILFKDEGFGVHLVNFLKDNYTFNQNVVLLDGSTMGYNLVDDILNFDNAIIIDALKLDEKPGSIYKFSDNDLPVNFMKKTAHEIEFIDVVTMCKLSGYMPKLTFLAVVPEDYENLGIELTQTLKDSIVHVARYVLDELKSLSIEFVYKN